MLAARASGISHPSRVEAPRPILFILRLATLLDHLTPTIAATALADAMRAHELIARRARNQCRRVEALVLAAIATPVA